MNRLVVRMIASHAAVALVGVAATYGIVRVLAPNLFDRQMQGDHTPMGMGAGASLRTQFADAVDQALLVGVGVGIVAAVIFGTVVAYGLVRPINRVRAATRAIARGHYTDPVPLPHERELADLAEDVNTLGRALAGTELRRTRLIGEVAHEMRTPLTVIDGYVEAMIDEVLPAGPAELGQVSEEVRRLRRLSDDLSALSRAEEGRVVLHPRRIDLRDVAGAVVERLRPQAEDAGLSLMVDLGSAELPVDVDADRIEQVVSNLIGNAIRATGPGGRIDVGGAAGDGMVRLWVADTGEGLAAEDLDRIFERFYRVPGRRTIEHETGSGIGLTIARGLARAHGGDLEATSPGPGRGARFELTLPRG